MVKFNEVMEEEKARRLNPVVLAFIGDAAYSLYIREKLVFASDYKTGTLQKLSSASVSAKGQAALLKNIEEKFTDTEREIFLRGRNAKKPTKSKNATVAEYNLSTGFEAVVGYLYLTGAYARLDDLLSEEQDEVRG
jgi:ribonuclease III family protein